jgi:dethiobiotin synthetase
MINPYCFEPSISPHIAAKEARIDVDVRVIRQSFETLTGSADFVVVEGAGGWYAPINESQAMADLPGLLDIPVLLVVGLRLGCLNHALLTKRAIEADGAELAGWVANSIDPALERRAENLTTLEDRLGAKPLAELPHKPDAQASARAGEQLGRRLSLLSF